MDMILHTATSRKHAGLAHAHTLPFGKAWLGLLALLVVSCLASCLDESPRDRLDDDQAYNSSRNIYINAVATLYNYIGGNSNSQGLQGTKYGVYDYNTFTTDEAIIPIRGGDWYDGGFWQDLFNHNWKADDGSLYDTWKYLYKVVVLCNESLGVIESRRSLLTDDEYAAYRAEVRAIRAMFYAYLMDMYGNVPMAGDAIDRNADARQVARPEMFRHVVGELQAVAPLLPDGHSNYEGACYGRVTRAVAWFLLAKLALNAEVYADTDWTDSVRPDGKDILFTVDGRQMNAWEACVAYCDKITGEGYTLAPVYASNFYIHNENSPENIFVIPMDKMLYSNQFCNLFRSHHYAHAGARSMASENGSCATVSTVRAFGYGTDSLDNRYADCFYSDTVYEAGRLVTLDNGEPLVYRPLAVEINLTYSPYVQTAGARMKKYEDDVTAFNDGNNIDNDIVLYRYADVLLMKAEAKVRQGLDGDAELNAVRSRSGMPWRRATLDNILTERLLELVWEGWRRQDMVRFGRFTGEYDDRVRDAAEQDGHTIVFPIPTKALELNPTLRQNPGY